MASAGRARTYDGVELARNRRRWLSSERFLPPLILGPSLIALFIFVYGFIGATIWVSLSNWASARINWTIRHPVGAMRAMRALPATCATTPEVPAQIRGR